MLARLPKYIEKCEKAKEMQANWRREDGDFILVHPTDSWPCPELRYPPELWSDVFIYQKRERQNYDKVIWLPLQDELQKVMKKKYGKTWNGKDWVK